MNETNGTSSLTTPSSPLLTHTSALLWCAAFAFVAFAIVAGNSLFLAALFRNRYLQKQRNYLLVSLACADILVGAVAIPLFIFLVIVTHIEKSRLSNQVQLIFIAVDISTGLTSMFSLTVIALERLYAISYPMDYRGVRKRTYFVLVLAPWVMAGLLTVINIASNFIKVLVAFYTYSLAVLTSVSLITILLSYVIVWIKIKFHILTSNKLFKGKRSSENERSLAVALFIVTVLFVTTWLPLHIMNIIVNLNQTLLLPVSIHVVFFAKFLQYSNSFYNPIVYSFKIPEIKKSFKRLLWCVKPRVAETRV